MNTAGLPRRPEVVLVAAYAFEKGAGMILVEAS